MQRERLHWPEERTELALRVDLEPVTEHRHRSRVAWKGTKPYVQTYPDRRTTNFKEQAAAQLLAQVGGAPVRSLCGPTKIIMVLWLPRPPSLPRYVKRASKKPDWDNLAKAVQDAIVDAGIFYDDGIVDDARVLKRYADAENPPGVDIVVIADPPETAAGARA